MDKWCYKSTNGQARCRSCHGFITGKPDSLCAELKHQVQYGKALAVNRKVYAKDPKKTWVRNILRLYGITETQYETLLVLQDRRCAICKKQRKLHIDHNHLTGKVRGLLCHRCNVHLGWVDTHKEFVVRYTESSKIG